MVVIFFRAANFALYILQKAPSLAGVSVLKINMNFSSLLVYGFQRYGLLFVYMSMIHSVYMYFMLKLVLLVESIDDIRNLLKH